MEFSFFGLSSRSGIQITLPVTYEARNGSPTVYSWTDKPEEEVAAGYGRKKRYRAFLTSWRFAEPAEAGMTGMERCRNFHVPKTAQKQMG
jgi:hypothetical protein